MPYCSRCGVEVKNTAQHCPLCDSSTTETIDPNTNTFFPTNVPLLRVAPRKWTRGTTSFLLSIFFLIPILMLLSADYIQNYSLEWAMVPVAPILMSWISALIIIWFSKKIILLFSLSSINLFAFLVTLGFAIPQGNRYFLPLALSIATAVFLLIFFYILYGMYTKKRGFNLIGGFFLVASLIPFFIDIFIKIIFFNRDGITPTWSLFVLFSCLPISAFFFYLHYIRKIYPAFNRFFHL